MKTGTIGHPKFSDLRSLLQKPLYQVVGALESMWQLTAAYAWDGELGKFTAAQISSFCEWDGDAEELISALVTAGWLDKGTATQRS